MRAQTNIHECELLCVIEYVNVCLHEFVCVRMCVHVDAYVCMCVRMRASVHA